MTLSSLVDMSSTLCRGRSQLKGQGAILVFLPGTMEISKLQRTLEASNLLRRALGSDSAKILPLHGSLPPREQQAVFTAFGPGIRKIVIATNVAETSLTIDDVTAVVDTGRMKETQFDATRGLARLVETWVSQAAAQQRKGRAGRVRCVHPSVRLFYLCWVFFCFGSNSPLVGHRPCYIRGSY